MVVSSTFQSYSELDLYAPQRGPRPSVKPTETASWWPQSTGPGQSATMSPRAATAATTRRSSVTPAPDTAGVWTTAGRRSPGRASDRASGHLVSSSSVADYKMTLTSPML
jgi:hypothetical protein